MGKNGRVDGFSGYSVIGGNCEWELWNLKYEDSPKLLSISNESSNLPILGIFKGGR